MRTGTVFCNLSAQDDFAQAWPWRSARLSSQLRVRIGPMIAKQKTAIARRNWVYSANLCNLADVLS